MKVAFHRPKNKDTKILAFGDVILEDGIIVRDFRVVDGANGVFAAVPSKPVIVRGESRFKHLVVFESKEIRERFLGELLEDYYRWRRSGGEASSGTEVQEGGEYRAGT